MSAGNQLPAFLCRETVFRAIFIQSLPQRLDRLDSLLGADLN